MKTPTLTSQLAHSWWRQRHVTFSWPITVASCLLTPPPRCSVACYWPTLMTWSWIGWVEACQRVLSCRQWQVIRRLQESTRMMMMMMWTYWSWSHSLHLVIIITDSPHQLMMLMNRCLATHSTLTVSHLLIRWWHCQLVDPWTRWGALLERQSLMRTRNQTLIYFNI